MYFGRFAPSPTGPLHFGSLVAAVASYADALVHHGQWLVRMEDVDRPRCVPGVDGSILRTLRHFGFRFEEPVMYQSLRTAAYTSVLKQLATAGRVYACTCSRKNAGAVYPDTCRNLRIPLDAAAAIRLRVDDVNISFQDRYVGHFEQNLRRDVGDFVLRRADGLFTYQLAVVVDDAAQGITDVVRGVDLLDSTPRQIYLQRLLGYPTPRYLHFPLATNAFGEKLSKQTLAPALDWECKPELLEGAIQFLEKADILERCIDLRSFFC